ncbi:proline-rich proteoglycan 2-like [Phocoena sinus]|uniref:proline-rich proteoglycan 2-like n=1 Tax=Phocoena sinus TaxID=42100 RepID=UPI0013C4E229|nr:proline-rich proteoglycan 2-like [Phocoena sinus]
MALMTAGLANQRPSSVSLSKGKHKQALRSAETLLSRTRRWGDAADGGARRPGLKRGPCGLPELGAHRAAGSSYRPSRVRSRPAQPKTKMAVRGAPQRPPLAIRPPAPPGLGHAARAFRRPASGAPWSSNIHTGGSDTEAWAGCAGLPLATGAPDDARPRPEDAGRRRPLEPDRTTPAAAPARPQDSGPRQPTPDPGPAWPLVPGLGAGAGAGGGVGGGGRARMERAAEGRPGRFRLSGSL